MTHAFMTKVATASTRQWLVRWMAAICLGHLLVGAVLSWCMQSSLFEPYHRSVAHHFWQGTVPAAAQAQQIWWIALFGATMQSTALWMAALVYLGNRYRSAAAWAWLLAGLVWWAPQDMAISLQADAWIHVWIDCLALLLMVPALSWLWYLDRKPSGH